MAKIKTRMSKMDIYGMLVEIIERNSNGEAEILMTISEIMTQLAEIQYRLALDSRTGDKCQK